MTTLSDHAKIIEVEALRRATLNLDAYLENDELRPFERKRLRLMLAKRYDRLIEQYNLDTHELLAETAELRKRN